MKTFLRTLVLLGLMQVVALGAGPDPAGTPKPTPDPITAVPAVHLRTWMEHGKFYAEAEPGPLPSYSLDQIFNKVFDATNIALFGEAVASGGGGQSTQFQSAEQILNKVYDATNNALMLNCISGCSGGGGGATFKVNGTNTLNQTTINWQSTANQIIVTNPTLGNVKFAFPTTVVTLPASIVGPPLSDISALQVIPYASSPTADILQVALPGQTITGTCAANPTECALAVNASGNLFLYGNNLSLGASGQTTASYLSTLGGSTSNSGPYFKGCDSNGAHCTFIYADPTTGGQVSLETAAITGAATAANVLCTHGNGQCTGTVTDVALAGTTNQITATGTCSSTSAVSCTFSFPAGGVTLPGTTSGTFSGGLTGNVTGNASGTAATITGALALANTPLTTSQDLLFDNAGTLGRLGISTVTSGQCLGNNSGAWGTFACSGGGGSGTVTESGATMGYIPLWGTVPNLVDSALSDNGTTITSTEPISITASGTGAWEPLCGTGFSATALYGTLQPPASCASGYVWTLPGVNGTLAIGPGSSTANHVASFSGTDGVTLADSGVLYTNIPLLASINTFTAEQIFTPAARTSGVLPYFKITTPTDTGQTASTEADGIQLLTGTRTWNSGTVASQSEVSIAAPTYAGTSGTATFTKAATLSVSGSPIVGSNAAITNAYSIWAKAGLAQLDGGLASTTGTFSSTLGVTGHVTFEGVTSTGATGTGNLMFSDSPTTTGTLTAAAITNSSISSAGLVKTSGSGVESSVSSARSISFQFGTPGGSAISTGVLGYTTIPFACTITGWSIQVDAGTATVKSLKVAAGTSIPTLGANSISTSGVAISSGTVVQSTTVSDFTSTTVAANDIVAADLITTSGVGYINFQLVCAQ